MAIKTTKKETSAAPKPRGSHKRLKASAIKAVEKAQVKKKPPTEAAKAKVAKFIQTNKLVRCGKISVYYRRRGQRKGSLSSWKIGFDKMGKPYFVDMAKKREAAQAARSKGGKSSGIKKGSTKK